MPQTIQDEIDVCRKLGLNVVIKIVREAYMVEERRIAGEQGYESPVCNSLEETHANYNKCAQLVMENLRSKDDKLFVCSHNSDTVTMHSIIINS